jgi:hypothetical protein
MDERLRFVARLLQVYRAAVRELNSTVKNPTERQEARAPIAELLGNRVRIQREGEAVYARLEMNSGYLRGKT